MTMPGKSRSVKLARADRRLITALLLFTAGLLLFVSIYMSLNTGSGIAQFDALIQRVAVEHSHPGLLTAMHIITNLLAPLTLGIATFIGGVFWIKRTKELWRPDLLAIAMGLAFSISFVVKNLTMRARPPFSDRILPFELNYSFPSGHVLALTTLLLVLGYLWYSRMPSRRHLTTWVVSTIAGTLLIAFSRIYLGYHWLTDVSASVGLSLVILAIVIAIDYFKPQLKRTITLLSGHTKK